MLYVLSFHLVAIASEGTTVFGPFEEPKPLCVARGRWGLDES